jgi:hypothetical protein
MTDYYKEALTQAISSIIGKGSKYITWDLFGSEEIEIPSFGTTTPVEIINNGDYDSYGDYVGGDNYVIFELNGRYWRKNGYYSSYGGAEWDGEFYEVAPVIKTITNYERKV